MMHAAARCRPPMLLAACALLLAAGLARAGEAGECRLRVGWDPYEPYSYQADGDGPPLGFDIDVVSRVAEVNACTVTLQKLAWDEILAALEAGRIDITVGTGYKPDRAAWSYYSEPYRKEIVGLLVRAGTAERFAGEDLDAVFRSGLVFGKTTGDTYHEPARTAFARYPGQVRGPVAEDENVRRLLARAIDGFLIEVNVAGALTRRLRVADRVEFHPLVFQAGEYRLQMSRATVPAELALRIDAALQELKSSGWLEAAMRRHGIRQ